MRAQEDAMRGLPLLALALASGTWCFPAWSANITHESVKGAGELVIISGDIEAGDDVTFRALSLKYPSAVIALDSAGGAVLPAIEIGKMVRLQGYPTLVASGSVCASACALIWVAGSKRFLSADGRVGFHASYRTDSGKPVETGLGNALVGRYLTLLNLPEKAVIFATMASPTEIEWLTTKNEQESGIDFDLLPKGQSDSSQLTRSDEQPSETGWRVAVVGACKRHCDEVGLDVDATESVYFVDTSTVRRDGDKVVFWYETRGKVPRAGMNRYLALTEADCGTLRFKSLKAVKYLDDEPVDSGTNGEFQYALPSDLMGLTIKAACAGRYYTGVVDDQSFARRLFSSK
jgi:hypothetical protein